MSSLLHPRDKSESTKSFLFTWCTQRTGAFQIRRMVDKRTSRNSHKARVHNQHLVTAPWIDDPRRSGPCGPSS